MTTAEMKNTSEIAQFMAAGNSTFTLVSKVTGARFTYRVRAPMKDDKRDYASTLRFVQVMTGSDNETAYSYLGTLNTAGYRHGGIKAKVSANAASALAFQYLIRCIEAGKLGANLEFWHEGRCGRCARKLTVPSSIASGFGPECGAQFEAVAA